MLSDWYNAHYNCRRAISVELSIVDANFGKKKHTNKVIIISGSDSDNEGTNQELTWSAAEAIAQSHTGKSPGPHSVATKLPSTVTQPGPQSANSIKTSLLNPPPNLRQTTIFEFGKCATITEVMREQQRISERYREDPEVIREQEKRKAED